MKKLLLITLVAGGLAFASAPRSDAQVYIFGWIRAGLLRVLPVPGYYYPYRYYQPSYQGCCSRPYNWSGGHRYYRHHRYHHNYRY